MKKAVKKVKTAKPVKSKAVTVITVSKSDILPDNDQWKNRFEIKSETSNRIYVIAQNKKKNHWGCSCPSWRVRRSCKHLLALNLPVLEKPMEVKLIKK